MEQNLNTTETIGAWKSIQVASLEEIHYCPNYLTNNNAHKLQLFGSTETLDFLPIVEKISISDLPQRTKSGFLYRIKMTAEFNCASSLIDNYFKKYLNKKVMFIAQDNNGIEKAFGSKNHLLFFNYQESRGKNQEQGVKTTITIEGRIAQKPVYIKSELV